MLSAFEPENRPVCVWAGDAEESEGRDGEGKLEHEEGDEDFGCFPVAGDEHLAVRVVRGLERKDLWLVVDGKGSAESFLKYASLSHCRYLYLKDLPNANTAQQIATITLEFYTQEHEVQWGREEGDICLAHPLHMLALANGP